MATMLDIPAHVPAERVVDFDLWAGPEITADPYLGLAALHDRPDPFYTPRNQGHWVVSSAKMAREVLEDYTRFSADLHYNPRMDENGPRLIPAQTDPPVQSRYRAIINPALSPSAVARMADDIRALSRELIEGVRAQGHCDFFTEIAQKFPIAIFMTMADLPFEDRFDLFEMVDQITHDPTPGAHAAGLGRMCDYLRDRILARRAEPGSDVLSMIASARIDGEYPPDGDIVFLAVNVVLGGLDTVVSGLSYAVSYLARHPDQYRSLVEDPSKIKRAIEELLRVYGVATTERSVTHDLDFHGVSLRKHDRFIVIPALYNTDPEAIDDPLTVDFDRSASRHMTFGAGPHHCIGAPLARLEMRIFLEEWIQAIPEFSLAPGVELSSVGGFVLQLQSLPLVWNPA